MKLSSAEAVEKALKAFVTVTANGKTFAVPKFAPGIFHSKGEKKASLVAKSDGVVSLVNGIQVTPVVESDRTDS